MPNEKATIPGLAEVRKAIDMYTHDREAYTRAFDRMMDDPHNDGAAPPTQRVRVTDADMARLRKQYPAAMAYVVAERKWHKTPKENTLMEMLEKGETLKAAKAAAAAAYDRWRQLHAWD